MEIFVIELKSQRIARAPGSYGPKCSRQIAEFVQEEGLAMMNREERYDGFSWAETNQRKLIFIWFVARAAFLVEGTNATGKTKENKTNGIRI